MVLFFFIVSFGLLFWNEGRVDLSGVAEKAIHINPEEEVSQELEGKFVSMTGVVKSDEMIGDTYLSKGNYLSVQREVEMYAWVEEKSTQTQKNMGGSETTETTYTYKKEWTTSPENSSKFKYPVDHQNPGIAIEGNTTRVKNAKIGMYNLVVDRIRFPQHNLIPLNSQNVILQNGLKLVSSNYLYAGKGTLENPEIGDIRIKYLTLDNPLQTGTVFGQMDRVNKKIVPYFESKDVGLYRMFIGTRDSAISELSYEYQFTTWMLRLAGFLLMWFGLMLLFKPISVFLDVLPILGDIGGIGIGLATFVVSLVLSIVTIVVSMIFHSVIAVILVVISGFIGLSLYMKAKAKKLGKK